jgi:hypothetical protein
MKQLGAALLFALGARVVGAQTDYRNLEAGQPLRVEDALTAPRSSLELQLPSARFERYGSGVTRWRVDPQATFGVAAFSEIELRVPVIYVVPPGGAASARTLGVAGVALGGMHAFGLERAGIPAVAVGSEILIPAGSLASPSATYALKAIATKTLSIMRVHVNAGGGTWSIRTVPVDTGCVRRRFPLPGQDPGCGAPVIPDIPCSVGQVAASLACMANVATALAPAATDAPSSHGGRWFAVVGADHAFGLSSTLLAADLVAERFVGLYAVTDWTAELGVRHQWSPQIVVDAGISRHFGGVLQSSGITIGGAYAFSVAR